MFHNLFILHFFFCYTLSYVIPDVLKLIKEEYQDKQIFALHQGNVEKLSFSISF